MAGLDFFFSNFFTQLVFYMRALVQFSKEEEDDEEDEQTPRENGT